MKCRLICIVALISFSCSLKKKVSYSDFEFSIYNKLFTGKKTKKYIYQINEVWKDSLSNVNCYKVFAYSRLGKRITVEVLEYEGELYLNPYIFEGKVFDSLGYSKLNSSLLKFDLMNNDTIDMCLKKIRKGVYKKRTDKRSYYPKY